MSEPLTVLRPEWVWTEEGIQRDRCVVVHAGRIVEVTTPDCHPGSRMDRGRLLIPGLVNAHSHAFQRAIRGHVQWAPGEDDFWGWRERMYAVANGLTPEGVEAVSRLAFVEMAEAGFTTVGEFHYLHHQADGTPYADPDELANRVIAAARAVGIRIVLLRVVYGAGGFGRPLGEHQARFTTKGPDEALQAVARLARNPDPLVTVGLAPHSVRAVPQGWLSDLGAFEGIVHAHVAEQPSEVAQCHAATGRSPLGLLHSGGLVHERFTAVHMTHPSAGDLDLLREVGASIAVCPSTEMDLGDGFLPVDARQGIRLCVGTDSHARIDGFAEVRDLEMHARAVAGKRLIMGRDPGELAARLLAAGTRDGAAALGVQSGIRVGAPADLVALDLDRPAALGVPPLEAAALVATPDWVVDVWVAGRQIVADGRHVQRDALTGGARPYLQQ